MGYFEQMKKKLGEIRSKKDVLILAIETSCDESSAAVMRNGRHILGHQIASQIELHKKYGGVVPEVASRMHVEAINPVIEEVLKEAGLSLHRMDAIAVTYGPGLVGALLVGVSTAKALAFALSLPLVGVNHIEGHISANYISHPDLEPPFLCLVVSGGHSHIIWVEDYGEYQIMGQTRDDAAGEAYDKVARALGLGYPGGPLIDRLSRQGDPHSVRFPRAYINENHYDFSFSGLKTAVINHLHTLRQRGEEFKVEDVAAAFQQAVVDVLVQKTLAAAAAKGAQKIVLAGGVAANSALRDTMKDKAGDLNISIYYPSPVLCTDNAAMIGCAGYYKLLEGRIHDMTLNAVPGLSI